jgi:uncharacterized protein YndB with AHSA1/START domain
VEVRDVNMDELPPIRYETYVAAAPSEVFEALATGDGWSGWFTTAATIEPREGGSYRFEWRGFGPDLVDLVLEGEVLAYEPDRRFSFEWDSGAGRTAVDFTLTPRGDGCVVTLTERGYPPTEHGIATALECAGGWGEALTLLKFYVEHGVQYGSVPE